MKLTLLNLWLACFIVAGIFSASAATHYLVPPETPGVNPAPPYADWATAATNVSDAINAANTDATAPRLVLATNGVYVLNRVVVITNAVTLRGFKGRDATIINGNVSYKFFIRNDDCVLDSLTITNGGGGVTSGNTAASPGGGTITNCLITGCRSATSGGVGIGNYGLCVIDNSIIRGNTNCGINIAATHGTGIVQNCIIENNINNEHGGGICLAGGNFPKATIRNCLIRNNLVLPGNYYGAGIYFTAGCSNGSVLVANCTIVSNSSYNTSGGYGITFLGKDPITNMVINCVIVSNTSVSGKLGNIFISNPGPQSNAVGFSCSTTYQNGFKNGQNGNTTNAPGFIDFAGGNYGFSRSSPCFNSGTNQDWMTNSVDLDGHARILHGNVDMGAYELRIPNLTTFNFR